jgi:hypothetical protein
MHRTKPTPRPVVTKCSQCGKPSPLHLCNACAPPLRGKIDPGGGGMPSVAYRHNGQPVYKAGER